MSQLFLKPCRSGLIVRDPRSGTPLPEAGAHKPDTPFWRRRMRSGDAVEATVQPQTQAVKSVPASRLE